MFRNVLFRDDFAVPDQPELFYLGSYRPLMYVEYRLWEWLVPGHLWMGIPKALSVVYALAAAALFMRFLRRLGVTQGPAMVASLIFCVHPIVTDALFWSSLRGMGLGLCLVLLGVDLLWFGRDGKAATLGGALVSLGALTYQWLLPAATILIMGAAVITFVRGSGPDRRQLLRCAAGLVIAAAILIAWTYTSRGVLDAFDDRRWPPAQTLAAEATRRYHAWVDNWVNVFMPTLALPFGYRRAWSLWKWWPAFWSGLALLAARAAGLRKLRLAATVVLPAGLSCVASAFVLGLPFGTFAWRTSLPALIGFVVGVGLVGSLAAEGRLPRMAFWAGALLILVLSGSATIADSDRRTNGFFEAIGAREIAGERPRGPDGAPRRNAESDFGGRALTCGYQPITRSDYSPLTEQWVRRHFETWMKRAEKRK